MPETKVLEQGKIYFVYRPRVNENNPENLSDVQRFYMVLNPQGSKSYRLIVVGQKYMPEVKEHERNWGFVDEVTDSWDLKKEFASSQYETKTRGERTQEEALPVGEGEYQIVLDGDHTHLTYKLELPKDLGEADKEFNIQKEASYIIAIKNPHQGSPRGVGLRPSQEAKYPKDLDQKFGDHAWIPDNPPTFLDYAGTQIVLIGAKPNPKKELGVVPPTQQEAVHGADTFSELHLPKNPATTESLGEGQFK